MRILVVIRLCLAIALWASVGGIGLAQDPAAQDLSALARILPQTSFVQDRRGGVEIGVALSQPVPWRVRVMDNPARLVVDTREVDWTGVSEMAINSGSVDAVRAGVFRQGWSRLVLTLTEPLVVELAEMATQESPVQIRLRLVPASAAEFAAAAAQPEPAEWALPAASDLPKPVGRGTGPIVVVLDPGHGGIDPGAERDGLREADLMLTFARELKETLLRDGRFLVVLTRDDDVFVPLEARISIARAAGAHVFLSLHADALAEGEASGATIYTLDDEATDEAAQALAERHDRDDLLSGVDLTAQDDLVAAVLMDMARTETEPRVTRLAFALEAAIKGAGLRMHPRPHQTGGFSVLKSPDIPSALLELGFMSSIRDIVLLRDAEWRAKMAAALRDGLKAWADEDASLAALRQP